MIRSTQRQVIALVVISVLVAHLISIGVVLAMRDPTQWEAPLPHYSSMRLLAGLYQSQPDRRPALLQAANAAGLDVRELPDSLARACAPDRPPCPPDVLPPGMRLMRISPDLWLGVAYKRPPPRPWRLHELLATIALVGLPALALSLWASRVVTAPLRRLTVQAEQVDPETPSAPLKVEGASEVRLLAEAFNRLIARLTRYAAGQRRLLAAVSHDLRTPLTRLRLRAETITDPTIRQKMVHDVTTMQLLINSTLGLLAAQEGTAGRVRVDVAALLQTVADEVADTGVPVTVDELAPLTLDCDPAMLRRAVENVLENADKYGGGGTLRLRRQGENAIIEVADNGPGLTAAEKDQVFEPWFRTDTARGGQGNGLGLAIVKAVMAALGGRVELADARPQGLIVRLIVPVA